ncbi:hypothetical protein G432_09145 [Sphingomonas sp. MM-1]|uniref:DUF2141 domain-containing protein n=1 Tax=Sphingomonas sp. MM-1 TaxID=745310 RepID=UPI0002C0D56F|nr:MULTISPECIES: DUF2141 domain-containing protein [unclassified Sphingomonas]AGH49554.1 hypothetical protein G432_09145 [Sphingomonas sp. MM-1]MDX3885520.1 DUF2141 domain-containing protein [Sphingomonas sp.]
MIGARLLLAALLAAPAADPSGSIEIAVTGVRTAEGRVHVDICPEAHFLKEDCPWSGEAPARIGATVVVVRGVPPGRYAAQGFHDRNGNGKVDRNLIGIPTEGIGFSNDAKIRLGPPKFADAAFDHGPGDQRIAFRLRHMAG